MDYPATWRKIDDLCALMDKSRTKMDDLRRSIIGKALREGTDADKSWALGVKRDTALRDYRNADISASERHRLRCEVRQLEKEIAEPRGGGS